MKQTSVEWLFEKLDVVDSSISYEYFEQAKKMEKQQQGYSEEDMEEYAVFCIKCDRLGLPCIIAKDWFKNYKK